MIRRIRLRPQTRVELLETRDWYDTQHPGLGMEFLRAFGSTVDLIRRHPEAYPVVFRTTRRAVMRRFPYNILYRIDGDTILIIACIHGRRHPKHSKRRV